MTNEKLCDFIAKSNGFKKTDIPDGTPVEDTGCLLDLFKKNPTKACVGICGKCRKKLLKVSLVTCLLEV